MHGHKTCTAFCLGVLLVVQEFETSCLLSVLLKTMQAVTGPVIFVWSFKLPDSVVVSVRLECIFLNVVPSMTAGTQHLLMWDIISFFFGVGGWWGVPDSVTIRSNYFFACAGLDATEAITEFALMCVHLSVSWGRARCCACICLAAEDQPDVVRAFVWQLRISQMCVHLSGSWGSARCACICLAAEDQPDVPHKTLREAAVVSSVRCYPLHYLYKALWKCENGCWTELFSWE